MSYYETEHKDFAEKSFTTKPKTRRLLLHKQQTVKNRACALQESFYPTPEVPYAAVEKRMALLLGIVDRTSVLAYLGRPATIREAHMDQTVTYQKTGTLVPKHHKFKRKLPGKLGYIDRFGLGVVYADSEGWWIHWNHTTQLTLPKNESNGFSTREDCSKGTDASKEKISLSLNSVENEKNDLHQHSIETDRREREPLGEREKSNNTVIKEPSK